MPFLTLGWGVSGQTESASLVRHGLLLFDPGGSKEGAEEERVTYQDNRKKAKKGMDTVNWSQRHWGMA